jgi:hypothetical protein
MICDHRLLDDRSVVTDYYMICAQVHTRHKRCVRYTLGARYLYLKRNAEKFGVRVIGRKIRFMYLLEMKYAEKLTNIASYCISS